MCSNKKTVPIITTKRGFPAMWEEGGNGSSVIITDHNGEPRRPVHIPHDEHLVACGGHALIIIKKGFHIVQASVSHGVRLSASIWRVMSIVENIDGASAEMNLVNAFSQGSWAETLYGGFDLAGEAAFRKAGLYNCRVACYIDVSRAEEIS